MRSINSRRGFTLIELSIVLVIIGLIIGGVLTGQQIIQNARITNAINAIQSYQAQLQTYMQNYGALPGDDANASRHFLNSESALSDGNGRGTIEGAFNAQKGSENESLLAWAHLRAAGLIKNHTDITAQPSNPFGGIYGFQNGAFKDGITNTVLCLDKVPAEAAQIIDLRLDDGKNSSGALQASTGSTDSAITAPDSGSTGYEANKIYTLCFRM